MLFFWSLLIFVQLVKFDILFLWLPLGFGVRNLVCAA